ncbi:DUF899 domain-containing protein [Methylopila sp. M107]|uniref:DUF899 domain-containing protein n=1 Tax=Methylopila sp. M107 TaxID=1101190 RepID=UPI00059103E9|nr:DUF899 domain-containing protein [Methylopila sp. M107]
MTHEIVSRETWLAARKALLAEEKAFTKAKDALSEKRRALPWTPVDEDYVFEGPVGPVRLSELFGTKSQLLVKHFMLGPDWTEGCIGCSFESDHIAAALPHLSAKDVAFVAVARAPIDKIEAFRRRMGWEFAWVSSEKNRFNYDYHVTATADELANNAQYYNYEVQDWANDELSGVSVFAKDEQGRVFHAYSSFGRGFEEVLSTYAILDILPKGREEAPGENLSHWVKHHDRYDAKPETPNCCGG